MVGIRNGLYEPEGDPIIRHYATAIATTAATAIVTTAIATTTGTAITTTATATTITTVTGTATI